MKILKTIMIIGGMALINTNTLFALEKPSTAQIVKEQKQLEPEAEAFFSNNAKVVKMSQGEYYLVSENGRYWVKNPLIVDTWSMNEYDSFNEFIDSTNKVEVDKMNFDFREVSPFIIGDPEADDVGLIIIDPSFHQQLSVVDYAFEKVSSNPNNAFVVVLTAVNDGTYANALSYYCALRSNENGIRAIGRIKLDSTCEPDASFNKGLVVPKLLGVRMLPYMINSSGSTLEAIEKQKIMEFWEK